jgi:segregation and condensation protein A
MSEKINQEQIYDLITGKEVSWHSIIYDLINTEQLDPWDINLVVLANKYLEKIKELEEANFFVSGKVLLAASFLLRLKAEVLLEKELKSLDEILFGVKEEKDKELERLEIDPNELPVLYPKTPLPRQKKVSLSELMTALNKAISTENRRIKREVIRNQIEKQTDFVLPKTRINVRDRIRTVFEKLVSMIKEHKQKIEYKDLVGNTREDKIACFLPVLHLENQKKVFLEQSNHFEDIFVWLFEHYNNKITSNIKDNETALADFFKLLK